MVSFIVMAHGSVLVVVESLSREDKPAVQPVASYVPLLPQVAHLEYLASLVGAQAIRVGALP